jgi:VWFA-related protein
VCGGVLTPGFCLHGRKAENRGSVEGTLMLAGKKHTKIGAAAVSCCLVFGGLCGGEGLPAQQGDVGIGQSPVPALSMTTREVLLDVVVSDAAGHPVSGLTGADFKVAEDGAAQTIRHLAEHQPMPAAELARLAAAPALPPNTFTNYTAVVNSNASTVILLDAMDTPVAVQMRLRQQVSGYLKHMPLGASIAIFQLDTEMHLIQGFSSDPKVLLAAAESKRDMPSMARPFYGQGETNELVRMQILRDGMQTMGRYLAGFPGRKNLIWFTAQLPDSLFFGGLGTPFRDTFGLLDDTAGGDPAEVTGALTVSRVAVYPVDTRGVQGMCGAFEAERRSGPTGNYASNCGSRQSLNHASLDMAAAATGGKAYYNTNDMGQVIADVVSDGSDYYTLAYATTNTKWNGQFQHVKVTVDRPGVKLEYRPGYYAIDSGNHLQNQIAAFERRAAELAGQTAQAAQTASGDGALISHSSGGFAAAMALGGIPPTEIVFNARLTAADATGKIEKTAAPPADNFLRPEWRNKPFRNYTILFDADTRQMRMTRTADGRWQGRVEFVAIVYDPTGAVVNTIEKTAILHLDDTAYRKARRDGLQAVETIAVPAKGNFFLRLGVHDMVGDRMGAMEIAADQIRLGKTG